MATPSLKPTSSPIKRVIIELAGVIAAIAAMALLLSQGGYLP